jgi:hypothetical protein
MADPSTTISRLRAVLGKHFGRAEIRTYLQRLREAGLLPQGDGSLGRGAGSAEVDVEHAVMLQLALTSSATPIAAPDDARAFGAYRLKAICSPGSGTWQPISATQTFLEFATYELRQAANDPNYRLVGWLVEPGFGIFTIDPAALNSNEQRLSHHLVGQVEPGIVPPPPLHDVKSMRPDFAFYPDARPAGLPSVRRQCVVGPDLLREVAALFAATGSAVSTDAA